MAEIFPVIPGRLVAIESSEPRVLTIALGSLSSAVQLADIGIVTQLSVQGQVGAQFQQAMNGAIYATAFGDRPGTLQLATLLNPRYAPGGSGGGCTASASAPDNIASFIRYYNTTKIGIGQNLAPQTIAVGSVAFRGYITGFSLSGQAQAQQIYAGQLSIVTVGVQ